MGEVLRTLQTPGKMAPLLLGPRSARAPLTEILGAINTDQDFALRAITARPRIGSIKNWGFFREALERELGMRKETGPAPRDEKTPPILERQLGMRCLPTAIGK